MESFITRASSYAGDIDFLIEVVAVLVGFWFFLTQFVLFSFLLKYRRSKSPKASYITGEKKEETKLIHWAHYTVAVCDIVIIVLAISTWYDIKQVLPTPDATVRIVGRQWAWKFTHPGTDKQLGTADDVTMVDELHVVVDKTYHFKLEAEDVIHSFSVPVFRLKQDAIPGRVITGWFKPTKTGEFDIQCAEICGIGHGAMAARIFIETEEQHMAWLQQHKDPKSIAKENTKETSEDI